MSKKKHTPGNKSTQGGTNQPKPTTTPAAEEKTLASLLTEEPVQETYKAVDNTTPYDGLLKKIFFGSAIVMFILMIFMSLGSGINEDDSYQNNYAQALTKFYSSFGKDTTALSYTSDQGSMQFYGGFFDITTSVINSAIGTNDPNIETYHDVRHVVNAILGFLAMLFTALLARHIAGWSAGLIALYCIFLTPTFLGHSLMNPKDIPMATGYIMTVYFIARFLDDMEKPKWSVLIGLTLAIALTISSRIGGLLVLGYFGMFVGIELWRRYGLGKALGNTKRLFTIAKYGLSTSIIGYFLAMLFWPYGLVDPINHPFEALSEMTKRSVNIKLLFEGGLIWGQQRPWYYPLAWMGITIPLFTLLGLVVAVILSGKTIKRFNISPLHLVAFAGIFPVAYIIYQSSTLHDAWRHLLFSYPPLVVLVAVGWATILDLFKDKKAVAMGTLVLLVGLMAEPALFIARNPYYPYVYFNPLVGGISGAFGKYETDYWGTTTKQGIEWLDKQGAFKDATPEKPVIIATNSSYTARTYTAKYGPKVKLIYTKYYQRDEQQWDYALYISRFVAPGQLSSRNWPPKSYTIKTINANNTPLLAIYKDDTAHTAFNAFQLMKNRDYPGAIALFNKELEKHPDNETAYLRLAHCYMAINNFDEALKVLDKALALAPDWDGALHMKGLCFQNQNKLAEAEAVYLNVLKINIRYTPTYQQLAVIYSNQNKHAFAVEYLEKFLEMEAPRKELYQFAIQVYERAGSYKADQYKKALQQMK